jgi:hypothetical protein
MTKTCFITASSANPPILSSKQLIRRVEIQVVAPDEEDYHTEDEGQSMLKVVEGEQEARITKHVGIIRGVE